MKKRPLEGQRKPPVAVRANGMFAQPFFVFTLCRIFTLGRICTRAPVVSPEKADTIMDTKTGVFQ